MKRWIKDFFNLLFPHCCVVCNGRLAYEEKYVCMECWLSLPRTNYHLLSGNKVEKLFWGQIEIERATSFFYYEKGNDYRKILYELKYFHCKEIGEIMGKCMAKEIKESGFFQGIDIIVPVPLHKKKESQRGYNQSEKIADGISQITGIQVNTQAIIRVIANPTQTRKSIFERHENVEGIFRVIEPSSLVNKHVLLIDDVVTTGATLLSCARSLKGIPNIKISILTLAVA